VWAGVLSCAALLVACARETDKVFDNPADPQSTAYVGHEVRDPKDPINVPSVEITDAPTTIKINVAYTYVATASDPNPKGLHVGQIVRYDWDFGDGTKKEDASATEQHTYTTAGTYTVTVTVTDDDGNTKTSTRQVTVTRGKYPVAYSGGPYTVKINVALTFNGTSNDSDGVVRNYEWDFDGDGTYDWSSTTTGQTSHTYATANTYTARLRVMDDDNNAATDSAQVTVTDFSPVATIVGGPYSAKINVPLTFNGSGTDADGQVVKYEWDFDGDGAYDWGSAATGQTSHTYTTVGTYTARLRVTDDDGNTMVGSTTVAVVETFNLWTTKCPMPTGRDRLAAAEIGGKLYVVGGYEGTPSGRGILSTLEVYDPVTDTWTTKRSMPTARYALAAAEIGGKLYVVGGSNGMAYCLSTLEVYDPATDTWTTKCPMPTERSGLAAAEIGEKLYVVGGAHWRDTGLRYLSTLEVYDPATDTWTTKRSMPTGRERLAAAEIGGKLYVVGGSNGMAYCLSTLEVYDPATDTWTTKCPMPRGRDALAAAEIGGKLYVVGGWSGNGYLSTLEVYDPATDTWTTKRSMPTGREWLAAAEIGGKLYVVGGEYYEYGPGYHYLSTLEVYE